MRTSAREIVERALSYSSYKYWYGGKGQIATMGLAETLRAQNPKVWSDSYFAKATRMIDGKTRVCDCSGLVCGAYGIPNIGSYQLKDKMVQVANSDMSPGMVAWRPGHCGIIIDNDNHVAELRNIDIGFSSTRTFSSGGFVVALKFFEVNYDSFTPNVWKYADGSWHYILDSSGNLAKDDWYIINNHWWYFDKQGCALMGVRDINGQRYCIDSDVGCMITDEYGALVPWFVEGSRHDWRTITT